VATEPWPETLEELEFVQRALAAMTPPLWQPKGDVRSAAGCFVCFQRGRAGPGTPGDPGWVAAALIKYGTLVAAAVAHGVSLAGYASGLLALRAGPMLERAVRGLPALPDVLLVNATGRDHPRRAGLALHLGARLDMPMSG
jgi:deoxyribonuclease V